MIRLGNSALSHNPYYLQYSKEMNILGTRGFQSSLRVELVPEPQYFIMLNAND